MDERDATVGLVGEGSGPAAVEAALGDVDTEAERIEAEAIDAVDLAVVVGPVGSDRFERANDAAGGAWIAVELGGIGGHPLSDVDAAVSVLRPEGGCFGCLRARVASNLDDDPEGSAEVAAGDARFAGAVAGRLAVAQLAGEDRIGTVIELPYAERQLLPAPHCACDAGPNRVVTRDHADVSLEWAVEHAERAIDDRLGLVREIGEVHSFPAPYYLATLTDTAAFGDGHARQQAAGVAVDWNEAFMKAVGEALERYSAGIYREASFTTAPPSERPDAVDPAAFVRPDDAPDPDPDEPIPWLPGADLATGGTVHLPAEFVQFPPPERRYTPPITTGLGLGASPVGALLSGLYEVIERDAAMLAWYSTFEPLGLEVDDEAFATMAKRARSEELSVTPLLVTQDVDVPVVSVAVHREGAWPRFAIGSGATLDPDRAARSALAEAIQNWMELRDMGPEGAEGAESAIDRAAEFPPAMRALVDPPATVASDDLAPADLPTGADELDAVVDRVTDVGLDAYAARLTPRDVNAIGFEAARVLVPAAQPLFTGDAYFGERATTVPRELGYEPRLDREPHPYP